MCKNHLQVNPFPEITPDAPPPRATASPPTKRRDPGECGTHRAAALGGSLGAASLGPGPTPERLGGLGHFGGFHLGQTAGLYLL